MATSEPHPTPLLLREAAWLERLARELVADPGQAADAAQETLLAANRQRVFPGRRWLARVLRNFVRQERRREDSRRRHELGRPPERSAREDDEIVERIELRERLLQNVRMLDEPYRTAVFLRFLEDVSVREIAQRLGVPVKTVHTRIQRGLERLRDRLDRDAHGDRSQWLSALVALVPSDPSLTQAWGVISMSLKAKWGVAVAIAAVIVSVVVLQDPAPPAAELATAVEPPRLIEAQERPVAGATERSQPAAIEAVRSIVETEAPPTESSAAHEPVELAPLLNGRVRDLDGNGIGGASMVLRSATNQRVELGVTTEPDGSFSIDPRGRLGELSAEHGDYATLISVTLTETIPPEDAVVVVAPKKSYAGSVVDEAGVRLAGVRLSISLDDRTIARIRLGTTRTLVPLQRTETDEQGRFSFPDMAFAEGLQILLVHDGFEREHVELPVESDPDLILVMRRIHADRHTLEGVVLEPDGVPAAGALVSTGSGAVRTDADGRFRMRDEPLMVADEHGGFAREKPRATWIQAVAVGHLPGRTEVEWTADGPLPVTLVLGDRPHPLQGRVVDHAGQPVEGARVWTFQGERFGLVERQMGEASFHTEAVVEDMMVGIDGYMAGRRDTTDKDGRFELEALLEREYVVFALHPVTLAWAKLLVQMPAGEVEFRLGGVGLRRVAGRVVALNGEPMADVNLQPSREFYLEGQLEGTQAGNTGAVTTDADGRFEIQELFCENASLIVSGRPLLAMQRYRLDPSGDLEQLVIELPAKCYARVIVEDPQSADHATFFDEDGETLVIGVRLDGVQMTTHRLSLVAGRSGAIEVDERARFLALFRDGEEVLREPVRLAAGELSELRY